MLATVVAAKSEKPGIDFFPLTVNYQEKTFAAGKIPGGFFKREGRPTEKETLTSRLIDRPIRPLFADGFRCETQVVVTVLSHDLENDPDIVAMVAASAALTISGVPFMGPIGGARVGLINGAFVLNPQLDEMTESKLDLVVAGTGDAVLMVESEAKELSEDDMLGAVMFGHKGFQPVIEAIIKLAERAAKEPRDLKLADHSALYGRSARSSSTTSASPIRSPARPSATTRSTRSRRRFSPNSWSRARGRLPTPQLVGEMFKKVEKGIVRGEILDTRHPHRRPRREDGPSDPRRGRHPAPHPRLGAVHPRRDPGARASPRSAPATTSSSSTRWRGPTRKPSCSTTISRPIRWARRGAWASPAGARSATASSPGAPSVRCSRRIDDFPYTIRVVSEITEFERLVLDGDRLRHLAVADGCGRAARSGRWRASPWA